MNRLARSTFLALAALLLVVVPVLACRPPEPTCPEGAITEEEAEWVDRVPGHWGKWRQPHKGKCPAGHNTPRCRQWRNPSRKWRHRHRSWVKAIPGYWIDPVCYGVCSVTTTIVGEYGEFASQGVGEGHERQRTITVVDSRDPTYICDIYTETDHACLPLFRMWLLEQYNHPNANGTLQCYVVSPTHPGVERYQRICWPCQYPDFVASRAAAGFVDSCDNWALDNERLYWRKSLAELLAMNARHAAGIYYPIVCEGCE